MHLLTLGLFVGLHVLLFLQNQLLSLIPENYLGATYPFCKPVMRATIEV